MSTRKKIGKPNFWIVIIGLLLVIGLIAAGTYALNEAGLLSSGTMLNGAAPPDFAASDTINSESSSETFTPSEVMPAGRPDEDGSGTLIGFAQAIGQLALVILPVYYGQKLFGWLEKRLRKQKLTNQAV